MTSNTKASGYSRNRFGIERPIISRRHLVLRRERQLLERAAAGRPADDERDDDLDGLASLKPGQEQLKSFYQPSLPAGDYSVQVEQTLDSTSDKLVFGSEQAFTVDAPQISLPAGSVYSVYPPQGHSDTVDILPHVVLHDPHLPWERVASTEARKDATRNKVPWLALLTFTQDELRVPATVLATAFDGKTQSDTTLAIPATGSDVNGWSKDGQLIISPLTKLGLPDSSSTNVVVLPPWLFTAFVTSYQEDTDTPKDNQDKPDVSRYRFLAHVRNINTEGMADAGAQEGSSLFSVVVAHRIGPLDTAQPTTIVAHLVSIEGVEGMDLPVVAQYVALCSLHSWTYTSLPASSLTPLELFKNVGKTLGLLRTPDSLINQLGNDQVSQRIADRLRDGYALTKYRTRTGEITAAITRGPLTPTAVKHPIREGCSSVSNSGDELQVLDPEVGLMDLSYSAAWNLGKAMAVANRAFAAALARLRCAILDETSRKAKEEALRARHAFQSRREVLRSAQRLPKALSSLRVGSHDGRHRHLHRRWLRRPQPPIDLSLRNPVMKDKFAQHVRGVTRRLASTLDDDGIGFGSGGHGNGDGDGDDGGGDDSSVDDGGVSRKRSPYNGHNLPRSADWATVLDWVLDRMYLIDIPAHMLISDPAYLPQESLRFFHIDANWIDAFLDGALSLANYAGSDLVRSSIKEQINEFLTFKRLILQSRPQVPIYGFLLRSKLVTLFPDLKVTADRPPGDWRAPVLRLENIDQDVMLCLFDRVPEPGGFDRLTFTQPPHQQCFSIAASVTADEFDTAYKRVHEDATEQDDHRSERLGTQTWARGGTQPPPVFVWGDNLKIRTLLFPAWSSNIHSVIQKGMRDLGYKFDDDLPSAALCAIQLNSPAYHMPIVIRPPQGDGQEEQARTPSLRDAPRTLKLLGAKGWKASELESEPLPWVDEHDPADAGSISGEMSPAWFRSGRMTMPTTLGLGQHLHFRRTRHATSLRAGFHQLQAAKSVSADDTSSPADPDPNLATVPSITISAYAWGGKVGTAIPAGTNIPQDLIFSVGCRADRLASYRLKSLRVSMALGDTSDKYSTYLTSNYCGPGATMLGNLRLCPRVRFGDQGASLNVILVPRSRTGRIPVENVADMGFVLPMVEINAYTVATDVTLIYHAQYDSTHVDGTFVARLEPANPAT